MKYVEEPQKKIEVIEEVDLLVVGGGPGGMPAAIAAARKGLKVLIVESYGFLGGLATMGLMGPIFGYAPMQVHKLPKTRQDLILGGIPVEFIDRLQAVNGAPDESKIDWCQVRFDPELYKHVCDWMVQESGARILFHSYASSVVMAGDKIDAVIIESKSGRQAIRAKMVIDATGDGDIAFMAREEYTKGRKADGLTQAMGTKFIIGGVAEDSKEQLPEMKQKAIDAIASGEIHAYQIVMGEISRQGITIRTDERTPTITRIKGDGTNVYDLTAAELKIRRDSYDIVEFYKNNVPGFENSFLRNTPPHMGVRETRQIIGQYVLSKDDVWTHRKQPETTVARGCWFFDIHCPRGLWSPEIKEFGLCGMRCAVKPECYMKTKFADQMLEVNGNAGWITDYYDIPYGTLVPKKTQNLLVAGRCFSADNFAMSSARVIATCMAMGEAAGTAAVMAIESGTSPKDIDVSKLQENLRSAGVPL